MLLGCIETGADGRFVKFLVWYFGVYWIYMENKSQENLTIKEPSQLEKAMQTAFLELEERMTQEEMKATLFKVNGKEYPVTNDSEANVANIQQAMRIAQEILDRSRTQNDYYAEKAGAKVFELLGSGADLALRKSEVVALYPEASGLLERVLAGGDAKGTDNEAGNDGRYLVKA